MLTDLMHLLSPGDSVALFRALLVQNLGTANEKKGIERERERREKISHTDFIKVYFRYITDAHSVLSHRHGQPE